MPTAPELAGWNEFQLDEMLPTQPPLVPPELKAIVRWVGTFTHRKLVPMLPHHSCSASESRP